MIEASSYDIFGITIDREDFESMRLAFANTYNQLSKENIKWQDVGFRKTQRIIGHQILPPAHCLTPKWLALPHLIMSTSYQVKIAESEEYTLTSSW